MLTLHVNREGEAAEELMRAVLGAELDAFRRALRASKPKHALFVAGGELGARKRMKGALRKAAAMCDGRCDAPSRRLGEEESAKIFWSAACFDWSMMYPEEDPRAYLNAYGGERAWTPPTPDEPVNLDFYHPVSSNEDNNGKLLFETEEQAQMRKFGTTRLRMAGVTARELAAMEVSAAHAPGAEKAHRKAEGR